MWKAGEVDDNSVLVASGLQKTFGGLQALKDVDVNLVAGTVLGIIGPNGAGKSTLINVLSGLDRASAGEILVDGKSVTKLTMEDRARQGLVRTFQHPHYFGPLTVSQVLSRARLAPRRTVLKDRPSEEDALERFGIERFRDEPVSLLAYGTKKLVNVAMAWLLQPRVLLLDEPFAGVGTEYAEVFTRSIQALAADGVAIGLVEHNIEIVMTLSQQLLVLDSGAVIFRGTPADGQRDKRVLEAYFGQSIAKRTA
jgi:branched-chain amino acid transport system ATP-binding protein